MKLPRKYTDEKKKRANLECVDFHHFSGLYLLFICFYLHVVSIPERGIYFPTQKRLKMEPRTSSVEIWPVMEPRW